MTQEDQIVECEKRLLEAMKTSNIKVLDELLHDNLVFNVPSGQTITKAMDIKNYQSGTMTVSEIWATDQMINSIDETSSCAVTIYLNGRYGEQIIDGKFRYLRVWKLFGTTWKVIAGSGFQI